MKRNILLFAVLLTIFFSVSQNAFAADSNKPCFSSASGLITSGGTSVFTSEKCDPTDLVSFINTLNTFFYRLAIVLAVLMITIGGLQWLMAIGNSGKISNAKDTIQQAVIGLILALTAILLFNQIDTSFTNLKAPALSSDYDFVCSDIKDPTTCTSHPAPAFCVWSCTDPEEMKKLVKPPNKPWSPKWQNPNCIPGVCNSLAAGASRVCTEGLAKAQNNHGSNAPELNTLIDCVKKTAVWSLVDENKLFTFDQDHNLCNFTRGDATCGEACSHKKNSCHYGGKTGISGSLAVDFNAKDSTLTGESILYRKLNDISQQCNFGFIVFENYAGAIHTHVSTQNCDSDGEADTNKG